MHGDSADHLPPLLRRPSDLGNRRQDERLTSAEDVHGGVDLGAEWPAEPRVDLLENDARPAGSEIVEHAAHPARRLGR